MKSRVLSSFIVIGCLGFAAMAQSSAKVVKVKAEQDGYRVKRGASLQAGVVIDIDSGYHINSNRPLDKFLVATAFKVEPQAGISAGRVLYPKPKMQKFSFSDKPMSVYEGRAVLKFTIRALPGSSPGAHAIQGKLTIQACNNEQCLRPQTINVEVPVEVQN
ncbi:MAG TPA: protein-disulfide reductase DsbD N-terminal domain-containing protein [Blastocatellia bacterium]|jgi:thiol:disulfide interchange protein DsbD|nr:protein-disulfide reductase DsbD N-terminal domain-containing protein [Blastocatellia bacterium]